MAVSFVQIIQKINWFEINQNQTKVKVETVIFKIIIEHLNTFINNNSNIKFYCEIY